MRTRVLAALFVCWALPAVAQTTASPWDPWFGCWEMTVDSVRDAAAVPAGDGPAPGPLRAGSDRRTERPRVCVTPADGGARFVTTVTGQTAVDYTTVADGRDRQLTEGDCRGTQRAEWSADGMRLYSRAELTCGSDAGPRRISGVSFFSPTGTWLDIQSIQVAARESVRVRRYYRAPDQPAVPRAVLSASALTLDDVKEASGKVAARALEAALVEANATFNLTSRRLLELDDAGVPDSVIDLMVALTYPDRFVVERRASGGGAPFGGDPYMLGWAFGYPVGYDDFFYSPYYYMPFGYSPYALRGYDTPYAVGGIGVSPAEPQPSGAGRVVDGQGYTRVRTRDAAVADNGPIVRSGGESAPVSSGDSSGGSTASSGGGYSSGSSSGDTGRTAVPR